MLEKIKANLKNIAVSGDIWTCAYHAEEALTLLDTIMSEFVFIRIEDVPTNNDYRAAKLLHKAIKAHGEADE